MVGINDYFVYLHLPLSFNHYFIYKKLKKTDLMGISIKSPYTLGVLLVMLRLNDRVYFLCLAKFNNGDGFGVVRLTTRVSYWCGLG